MTTQEIVAYDLSTILQIEIVYRTLTKLERIDYIQKQWFIRIKVSITRILYINLVERDRTLTVHFTKGKLPGQHFNGILLWTFEGQISLQEGKKFGRKKYLINDSMDRYDNTRKQWVLKKMTPRSHLISS